LLGIGWHLEPYNNRIRQDGSSLILVLSDRTAYRFTPAASGQWHNTTDPFLLGAVITELPGGRTFQLRFKDGTVHRFEPLQAVSNASGLAAIVDRNGNAATITRQTVGGERDRITRIESGARSLVLAYDGGGRLATVTDPIGRQVQYTYDVGGRLETVTDPAGGVTRYAYDVAHRITSITDARGIEFLRNVYDGQGRVIQQFQADDSSWRFAYTAHGEGVTQATVTNPRGHVIMHRFDPRGFPLSRTDATGQTTPVAYAAGTNLVTERTDPLGRSTRFDYDPAGNVTGVTGALGAERTLTYEPAFHGVASVTDAVNNTTRFEYDARGNVTAVVNPAGERTTLGYTGAGDPASVRDPLGNTTLLTHDGNGNLIAITTPVGHTERRQYDPVGRVVRQTDPRGRVTAFAYDALNRLTSLTDGLGGVTGLTYDENGNLLTVTDARGGTTMYTYDSMDRVASRRDAVGGLETFEYDAMGNLTRHVDRKGQVALFTYDDLNRRIGRQDGAGTVTHAYDAGGRLISLTSSEGRHVHYTYDALDRLVAERGQLGTMSYGYDLAGRRIHMDPGGAARVTYGYDAASRVTSISQPPLAPATLEYDGAGRRARLTLPNGVSTEYQYDGASRLTALQYRNAAGPLGSLVYRYDRGGNRIGMSGAFARSLLPEEVASAVYDPASRQLAFGAATMTYDASGSLITLNEPGGTTEFDWDARGRLTGLQTPSMTAVFAYDPLGRRVERQLGASTTGFLYDGQDIIEELTGTGEVSYLRTLAIDEPLSRGLSEFYLADPLGSVVALAGPDGALHTSYTYAPFGAAAVVGASGNPFQFTGREHDTVDIYYYRARYYLPHLGRFASEDALALSNLRGRLYHYAGNNPLLFTDPLGLFEINFPIGAGLSGVFGPAGGEVSGGLAATITINSLTDIGFKVQPFTSIGKPIGLGGMNFSGDIFAGFILGNLAGQTTNVNVSVGPVSITALFDPASPFRLLGATLGTGPTYLGLGVSVTDSTTLINRPASNPIEDLSGIPMALVPRAQASAIEQSQAYPVSSRK
jgi:RHS repeat-associated protein